MFEQIRKTIDKGLEFAFMTKDRIQASVAEIAKENNLTKEEAKKLLDQLVKKSEEAKKNLEDKIVELQKAAINKMNLVTREEYDKLELRLKKLESSRKTRVSAATPSAPAKRVVKSKPVRKK